MRVLDFTAEETAVAFVAFIGRLSPNRLLADHPAARQRAMACRHQRWSDRQIPALLLRMMQLMLPDYPVIKGDGIGGANSAVPEGKAETARRASRGRPVSRVPGHVRSTWTISSP